MSRLENKVLEGISNAEIIDVADPENENLVRNLDYMVENNLMLLSAIQTVPSIEAERWETLVQHGSFMLGVNLKSRDTEVTIIMDSRGHISVGIKRGGKVLQKIEVDAEPDNKLES